MFYRQGGGLKYINPQYDSVYVDFVGGATGWLPVVNGNIVAVNVSRATIVFNNPAQSTVTRNPVSPEVEVLMELKQFGGLADGEAWPIDRWQNLVVADSKRISMDGFVRLRVLDLNNVDGEGVALSLQINRNSGASGARSDG